MCSSSTDILCQYLCVVVKIKGAKNIKVYGGEEVTILNPDKV